MGWNSLKADAQFNQALITNGNLETVDEGLEFIVRTDKAVLDG